MAEPSGDIYTPKEVASRLKMPLKTVLEYLRRGTLPGFRIGKHWRVRKVDLDTFLEARAKRPLRVVEVEPLAAINQAIREEKDRGRD
jgi:excisionase family DNA binding protein